MAITLQELGLLENPFEYTTPTPSANMVWAGMHQQKRDITRCYEQAFQQNARQLILNWGPWGGGKTYAAYYFKHNRIQYIANYDQVVTIYIRTPEEGEKASNELLNNIIDAIGWDALKNTIAQNAMLIGHDVLEQRLYDRIASSEFARAVLKLATDTFTTDGYLLAQYFYNGLDKKEKAKYRISRDIKSISDRIKFVSALLVAYTQTQAPKRLFIWIDEMENAIFYTAKQAKEYAQTIRDLTDTINEYVAIFLNLTLAEADEQKIDLLLREALLSRINTRLRFKDFSTDDTLTYIRELLQAYQISPNPQQPYSPFTEDAITTIIQQQLPTNKRLPRNINKTLHTIIQNALQEDKTIIGVDDVKKTTTIFA
ncbi:MAG TPA: hypothetical protein PK239_16905 [Chitinophagales bacterium]|nr:hypothetical protein [Chitinophagales bacterium]